MALPNKPLGELPAIVNPEIIEHECDVLIVGGGMAACGTAFEIKKWAPADMKILLVDKASMERSGAVAQGLSAINTYIGENPIENYVKMVRNDLMGVVREDLIYDLGRHVDDSVHLFEEWGLPVWKIENDLLSSHQCMAYVMNLPFERNCSPGISQKPWQMFYKPYGQISYMAYRKRA